MNQWPLLLTTIAIGVAVAGAGVSTVVPERRAAAVLAVELPLGEPRVYRGCRSYARRRKR